MFAVQNQANILKYNSGENLISQNKSYQMDLILYQDHTYEYIIEETI